MGALPSCVDSVVDEVYLWYLSLLLAKLKVTDVVAHLTPLHPHPFIILIKHKVETINLYIVIVFLMNLNIPTDDHNEAISFGNHLRSEGHDNESARENEAVLRHLLYHAARLKAGNHDGAKLHLSISACNNNNQNYQSVINVFEENGILLQGESAPLLPYWKRFADVLMTAVSSQIHTLRRLDIIRVQLSNEVLKILLQSLKGVPLQHLILVSNAFESEGFKCIIELLKTNNKLEELCLLSNPIENKTDAKNLLDALIEHPTIASQYPLQISRCGVERAILPGLLQLNNVNLEYNNIASDVAKLIIDCLACNPAIGRLCLSNNLLSDGDAKGLSESLKTNTNLRILILEDNLITQEGFLPLLQVVSNWISLNLMSESNHTCQIEDDAYNIREVNKCMDPEMNREIKLFIALTANYQNWCSMKYLNDTPIEVFPRILFFLHSNAQEKLSVLFRFMSEWSMHLLYTNRAVIEPRRSGRIRKKMVMKYMEKK